MMNTGAADFGAIKADFVPNTTLVPVLGALFWLHDGKPDDADFRRLLARWYWCAVLSEDYSGSSDTVMARDFREWRDWMDNGGGLDSFGRVKRITQDFITDLDLRRVPRGSSRYNAIICMLALRGAKDFYEAQPVGSADYSNERINDHHIFPARVRGLPSEGCEGFADLKDCILNRTLLLDETNNHIRNRRPSEYVVEMLQKHGSEEKVKAMLDDHLITEKAYELMKSDDFDGFLAEREAALKKHIVSLLGLGGGA
jgi:hypothetical protein